MKMVCKPMIHRLYEKVNVTLSFPCNLLEQVQATFDLEQDVEYEFAIEKKKNKRSLDANAYAWVLIGKLARYQKLPTTEVYRRAIEEMPTYQDITLKAEAVESFRRQWGKNHLGWIVEEVSRQGEYVNVRAFYGSSAFNTEEMSLLIDNLIYECSQARIPVDEHSVRLALKEWV